MAGHRKDPTKTPLKQDATFREISRKGRWVHGLSLSLGVLANQTEKVRIGLRTRRGLKLAVVRNRLKRQLRAAVYTTVVPIRPGVDLVIVLHPKHERVDAVELAKELFSLCQKARILSVSPPPSS